MRLVDAERLKLILRNSEYMDAFVDENGNTLYSDHLLVGADYDDVCKAIDEQPTVEPERKTATWLIHGWGDDAKCSNCGRFFKDAYDMDNYDQYCRHCGTHMKGIRTT